MWLLPLWIWGVSGLDHPVWALEREFEERTGVRLVFTRAEMPSSVLYDHTPELSPEQKRVAVEILVREANQYPRGLLSRSKLYWVGVFASCGHGEGDGFRPWDESVGGYRYFGRWSELGAIVLCFYNEVQLPMTFHHEVFHHLDAVRGDRVAFRFFTADDQRFARAVAGKRRYPALTLTAEERELLKGVARGRRLVDAVGLYTQKSAGEDQAETARWLQMNLADGLLQAAEEPKLAGSQRILHVLRVYQTASPLLDTTWWVDTAVLTSDRPMSLEDPELHLLPEARR